MRSASIERKTKETEIFVALNLDGGAVSIETGVGFFDHMLTAFAVHGGFGLTVKCSGDLQVDCHHTVEDTGIVLGKAFLKRLGTNPVLPATARFLSRWTKRLALPVPISAAGRSLSSTPVSRRKAPAITISV